MIELNKLYNADCMDLMKNFPDKSFDISITSPPYNLGNSAISGNGKKKSYNSHNDNMEYTEYKEWIFDVIDELLRLTKYHIFFNIQETSNTIGIYLDIENAFREYLKETFIWAKTNPPSHIVDTRCANGYEKIYCFSHDNPTIKKFSYCNFSNRNGDYMKNIIITSVNSESSLGSYAFPLRIPTIFIKYFSKENDIVLDCFSGSGTTVIACINLKRQWIGIEKDKGSYEKSQLRIDKELIKIKMF